MVGQQVHPVGGARGLGLGARIELGDQCIAIDVVPGGNGLAGDLEQEGQRGIPLTSLRPGPGSTDAASVGLPLEPEVGPQAGVEGGQQQRADEGIGADREAAE